MRVVVTGGAGFIGSHVVTHLLNNCADVEEVIVVDDLSTGKARNLPVMVDNFGRWSSQDRRVRLIPEDIARSRWTHEPCDSIIHLASRISVPASWDDPEGYYATNVLGTLNVIRYAIEQDAHVTFASSAAVYGEADHAVSEMSPTDPANLYGASKAAGEALLAAYSEQVPSAVFRMFNVYGPRQPADHQYAAAIPIFLDHALRRSPVPVFGDGQQVRDFTYVQSVVPVLCAAALGQVVVPPTNLAFGKGYTVAEVLDSVRALTGRSHLPVEYYAPRLGDVRISKADPTQLLCNTDIHLQPDSVVPLGKGLEATWQWFQNTLGGRVDGP